MLFSQIQSQIISYFCFNYVIQFVKYSSFRASSPTIAYGIDDADNCAAATEGCSPEKSISNFDRKISVSEADQANLDSERELKPGDSCDKQKNPLPRDTSVEALASK